MQQMKKKRSQKESSRSKQNKTISSINQAQTNAQVDNAKNTGMDEMSLIHPATTTKTDAKTALDQKLNSRIQLLMVIMMQQTKRKLKQES